MLWFNIKSHPLMTSRACVPLCLRQWRGRKERVLSDFNSQFWNSISPHPSQPMGARHGDFLTHLNSSLGNFEVQWENVMSPRSPLHMQGGILKWKHYLYCSLEYDFAVLPHLCMKLTVKLKYPIFKMAAGKIMGLEFT